MIGCSQALVVIALISAACMSGCLNQGTPPNNVDIKDSSFQPATITVNAGTTVTWNNHDSTDETVIADDGSFSSGNISTGYEFRHTFLQPGTYTYHSGTHPSMRGEVIVSSTSAYPNATSNASSPGTGQGTANATAAGNASASGGVTVSLVAKNILFDKKSITVPAGSRVTMNFDNQDSGIPHNFAAYTTSAATDKIFVGQIITGPKKTTYTFTAPSKPGIYFFRCDVHPTTMTGQLIVMPSAGASTGTASSAQNETTASNQTVSGLMPSGQAQTAAAPGNNTSATNATSSNITSSNSTPSSLPSMGTTGINGSISNATGTGGTSASGASAVAVSLIAKNIAFDKKTITIPAGAKVTLNFDNQDSGIPHNFAAYTTTAATDKIFIGQIITGPKSTTYTFTAPSTPGTYFFRCDVHPMTMTGQLIVTPSAGASAGSAPSSQNKTTASNQTGSGSAPSGQAQTAAAPGNASATNATSSNITSSNSTSSSVPSMGGTGINESISNATGTGGTSASGASAVTISLIAKNIAFDKKTITAPAGAKVILNFDNQDSGVPHNFAAYTTSAATDKIFVGQIITGPKSVTYTFTAPSKPGTYFFRCDVHPTTMTGQLVVTAKSS